MRDVGALLDPWNGFYVMLGSAAAALTSVMFVVISLVSGTSRMRSRTGVSTFTSPTVFHFCCVLFAAAVLAAPLHSLVAIAILLAFLGAAGVVYVLRVARSSSQMETYAPDVEDWTWHVGLPLLAYATFVGGAVLLHAHTVSVLFALAASATLLIFIGIHNAWDVVTYIAIADAQTEDDTGDSAGPQA